MGRYTNVLLNRRENRQAKAELRGLVQKDMVPEPRALLFRGIHPCSGPGGQHDPKVTNQRPSGTVKPHTGSRGTQVDPHE